MPRARRELGPLLRFPDQVLLPDACAGHTFPSTVGRVLRVAGELGF